MQFIVPVTSVSPTRLATVSLLIYFQSKFDDASMSAPSGPCLVDCGAGEKLGILQTVCYIQDTSDNYRL